MEHHEKCYQEISETEIKEAITKLKPRKAAGWDGTCMEIICDKTETLTSVITKVFNKSWSDKTFPAIWSKGAIQLLHKKKTKLDLDNYRQITVQCTMRQLFCRVIETRMKNIVKLSECQNGFREKRSSTDNLYIINEIIQQYKRTQKHRAFIAFIDFRKAFDSLHVDTLISKLKGRGITGNMLEIIASMYQRSQSAIKYHGKLGKFFPVERGVAQGCILSPLLFAIYLDDLLITLQKQKPDDSSYTNCLAYADDLVLITRTKEDLKRLLIRQ